MSDMLLLTSPVLAKESRETVRDILDVGYIITATMHPEGAITAHVPDFVPYLQDVAKTSFNTEVAIYTEQIPEHVYQLALAVPSTDRHTALAQRENDPVSAWVWESIHAAAQARIPAMVLWQMRLYALNESAVQMLSTTLKATSMDASAVAGDGSVEVFGLVPPF